MCNQHCKSKHEAAALWWFCIYEFYNALLVFNTTLQAQIIWKIMLVTLWCDANWFEKTDIWQYNHPSWRLGTCVPRQLWLHPPLPWLLLRFSLPILSILLHCCWAHPRPEIVTSCWLKLIPQSIFCLYVNFSLRNAALLHQSREQETGQSK